MKNWVQKKRPEYQNLYDSSDDEASSDDDLTYAVYHSHKNMFCVAEHVKTSCTIPYMKFYEFKNGRYVKISLE